MASTPVRSLARSAESVHALPRETVPFRGPGAKLIIGGVGETKEGEKMARQQRAAANSFQFLTVFSPRSAFFLAMTTIAAGGTLVSESLALPLPLEKLSITHCLCGWAVLDQTLTTCHISGQVSLKSQVQLSE